MKKLNKKGFTLTELIVVIAVIAILAAVLIPSLTGYIEKARISADNQEVAVLNKLLLGVQIDEVEFENVPQLKKYLEEEMDYDGDYSLSVKGNYLFYDTEKYEFIIIKDADVTGLNEIDTDSYKLASPLKSPEGLLVNNNNKEVLLVGGNGELITIVEEIRNIGNTVTTSLKHFSILENYTEIKPLMLDLFDNYAFGGSENIYEIDDQGNLSESTGNKLVMSANGTKTTLTLSQLRENFNAKYITDENLSIINATMKIGNIQSGLISKPTLNENGEFDVNVTIDSAGDTTGRTILSGISKIIEIIKPANPLYVELSPAEYTKDEYVKILESLDSKEIIKTERLNQYLNAIGFESGVDISLLYTIDIDEFLKDNTSILIQVSSAINIHKSNNNLDSHYNTILTAANQLNNRNVSLYVYLQDENGPIYYVKYNFRFTVIETDTQE